MLVRFLFRFESSNLNCSFAFDTQAVTQAVTQWVTQAVSPTFASPPGLIQDAHFLRETERDHDQVGFGLAETPVLLLFSRG